MEIKPKIGIENVYFGLTMDEVRSIWGNPDSIDTFTPIEAAPEDRSIDWEYSNGIELSFDSDDNFYLSSITCESEVATIDKLPIIGITAQELKLRFPSVKLDDEFVLAIDEYRHPELQLSFWVKNNRVNGVAIYPEYNEAGSEIIWPYKII